MIKFQLKPKLYRVSSAFSTSVHFLLNAWHICIRIFIVQIFKKLQIFQALGDVYQKKRLLFYYFPNISLTSFPTL